MRKINNIFSGKVYCKEFGGFNIYWESKDKYRHWCFLEQSKNYDSIMFIMYNPGSLSEDGKNIAKDSTLRVLRSLFDKSEYNCLIINLWDYATPKPINLYNNWSDRDSKIDIKKIIHIKTFSVKFFMFAYGNLIVSSDELENKNRIEQIRKIILNNNIVKEIVLPLKTKSGNPLHPYNYNFEGNIKKIRKALANTCNGFIE